MGELDSNLECRLEYKEIIKLKRKTTRHLSNMKLTHKSPITSLLEAPSGSFTSSWLTTVAHYLHNKNYTPLLQSYDYQNHAIEF